MRRKEENFYACTRHIRYHDMLYKYVEVEHMTRKVDLTCSVPLPPRNIFLGEDGSDTCYFLNAISTGIIVIDTIYICKRLLAKTIYIYI